MASFRLAFLNEVINRAAQRTVTFFHTNSSLVFSRDLTCVGLTRHFSQ